jgi:putative hydrolase of the HAD superfamily
MPVRAILFDLDDTLLETHRAHRAAMRRACRRAAELHAGWTAEQFATAFTRAYHELEAQLETGALRISSQLLFRTRIWEETLPCGLSLEQGGQLARTYLEERRRRYELYPDVPAALERLAQGYRLGIVTNGIGELQREKIRAVGLERWIPDASISGELDSWKPDAAIFRHALDRAGVAPEEAVMVGDSLQRDVRGAQAVGIGGIWMRRYAHLEPVRGIEPSAVVKNLDCLEHALR